ncbi:MAG: MATE family efflux transporter [Oscillospiraceae bacterium]|nr:MATE family efflux transporter [Oscillospiraceae bacterium]
MNIQLSDHFTYGKLFRFTLPSVIMMIFTSIYGVVDGIFVSNFVGKTPFAALNFIMPFLMIFGGLGFMVGTGGSALVSKTLGEGDRQRANGLFSMLIWTSCVVSVLLAVLGFVFMRPVARLMGAQGEMLEYCVLYGRILTIGLPAFILQNEFQSFLITAERPKMGLAVTVAAGVTNIVLDALLVAALELGLAGAAVATIISQIVGGMVPLVYFLLPNRCTLKLTRPCMNGRALARTCTNGSSELMTHWSMSLVNMLYNVQLMRFAGEDGVSAYGVIMYVNFIFISVFLGYSIGSAPLVGYHFGAQNTAELKNLYRKSLWIMGVLSLVLTGLGQALATPLAAIFVHYDAVLMEMTRRAFMLYALSFLMAGFNIFASAFFTALNDGLVSASISFLRTLVFQAASVLLLPLVLDLDGVWLAIVLAETLALGVSIFCFARFKGKYGY